MFVDDSKVFVATEVDEGTFPLLLIMKTSAKYFIPFILILSSGLYDKDFYII